MRYFHSAALATFALMLLAVAPPSSAPSAPSAPSRPAEVVHHFYASAGHSLTGGLPTDAELEILRPLLNSRLYDLFVATREYQAKWMARHPDEPSPDGGPPVSYKPPFADFDYFTGYEDGAKKYEVGAATQDSAGRWRVPVRSLPEEGTSPWTTRIVVVVEGDRPVIDDILYGSPDGKSPEDSLSESLRYREED